MDRIVISGLNSEGVNKQEFSLNTRSIQAIIGGTLLIARDPTTAKVSTGDAHTHSFTGNALADHTHTENTEASYTQNATTEGSSGGTPAGTNANESTHQHTFNEAVYSKTELDVKTNESDLAGPGDILLIPPTTIQVYDDLDVDDMVIMVVVYEGAYIRA